MSPAWWAVALFAFTPCQAASVETRLSRSGRKDHYECDGDEDGDEERGDERRDEERHVQKREQRRVGSKQLARRANQRNDPPRASREAPPGRPLAGLRVLGERAELIGVPAGRAR